MAHQQVLRLELAMCDRRRWRAADFRSYLVEHPLVVHLARRLVWGVYDAQGALQTTFRVAEDRTLADVDDNQMTLDDNARVGLVHRLDLSDAQVARWGQVWSDYELVQPFEQLSRETFVLRDDERGSRSLGRHDAEREVSLSQVLSLLNRGWEKGPPQDAGLIWWLRRPLPGARDPAKLHLSPGLYAGGHWEEGEAQKLEAISLPVAAGDLDPALCSELLRDISLVMSD